MLDQNIDVASLTIAGELVCAAQDLTVRAGFVMVHTGGKFVCGTAGAVYKPTPLYANGRGDGNERNGELLLEAAPNWPTGTKRRSGD